MRLYNFQEKFSWKDSIKGVALKRPWLQTMLCTIRYANSNITIQNCRAEKRTFVTEGEINDTPGAWKRTRFHSRSSSTEEAKEVQCFFCRQPAGTDGVHEVATFQMDSKIRDWATILEDTDLLGRLRGAWSHRTPSTIISAYRCYTTVLERQSVSDPNTKPMSEKYQVLSSPNWFST